MKTILTTIALVAATATASFAQPVTVEECISVYAPDSADGGSFELFSRSVMEEVAECSMEAGRYQESKDIRSAISDYNQDDAIHFWIDGTDSFLDRVYGRVDSVRAETIDSIADVIAGHNSKDADKFRANPTGFINDLYNFIWSLLK